MIAVLPRIAVRALALLSLFAGGGCKEAPRQQPPPREELAEFPHRQNGQAIAGPEGARWSRAWASIEYLPPERGYHARHHALINVVLHLVVDGREQTTLVDQLSSSDLELSQFLPISRARPVLRAASDGHALALSVDAGARWSLIIVDAGDRPFSCLHRAADPARLPATRELVLEILREPTPHWTLRGSSTPRATAWSDAEVMGALRYAQAHPGDAELEKAWASYVVRPGREFPYADSEVMPILDWMRSISGDSEPVRAILVDALSSTSEELSLQRARAARALAGCSQPEVQDALARLVKREMTRPAEPDRFAFSEIVWSLAAVTAARRAASAEALETLAALARAPDRTAQHITGRQPRLNAIRALAAIPTRPARAVLTELASAAPPDERDVNWSAEFTRWNEPLGPASDVASWARAALAINRGE